MEREIKHSFPFDVSFAKDVMIEFDAYGIEDNAYYIVQMTHDGVHWFNHVWGVDEDGMECASRKIDKPEDNCYLLKQRLDLLYLTARQVRIAYEGFTINITRFEAER